MAILTVEQFFPPRSAGRGPGGRRSVGQFLQWLGGLVFALTVAVAAIYMGVKYVPGLVDAGFVKWAEWFPPPVPPSIAAARTAALVEESLKNAEAAVDAARRAAVEAKAALASVKAAEPVVSASYLTSAIYALADGRADGPTNMITEENLKNHVEGLASGMRKGLDRRRRLGSYPARLEEIAGIEGTIAFALNTDELSHRKRYELLSQLARYAVRLSLAPEDTWGDPSQVGK